MQFFQGDVSIIKLDKLPYGLTMQPLREHTVAIGEKSGHHHVLVADHASNVEFSVGPGGKTYMHVKKGTVTLNHWTEERRKADHDAQTFDEGFWQVGTQREYDEMSDRKVVD